MANELANEVEQAATTVRKDDANERKSLDLQLREMRADQKQLRADVTEINSELAECNAGVCQLLALL